MLFSQSDNLFQAELGSLEQGQVVTPSPQMADIIRRRINNSNIDVITISKFMRDELSVLKGDSISENYRGKAELLLLLSSLWKQLEVPNSSYELFQRCFRLLTDLRSFSMSADVLETALEEFDPSIAHGVLRMHQVLEGLDIYDEHRSYFELSEQLRSGDIPITYETERTIVFAGFDFLSASQVDLLKSYAIRDEVIVPVYESVYENRSALDWVSWLDSDNSEVTVLDEGRPKKTAKLSFFPKNYLNKALGEKLKATTEKAQIILGERNSSYEKIQQALLAPSRFKSPTNIINDKVKQVGELLRESLPIETEAALGQIESEMAEAIESQDFRAIRALQLWTATISEWSELSASNEVIEEFDLRILEEATHLDSPRVFQTAMSKGEFRAEIKGLKELDDLSKGSLKIFCVSGEFSSPKANFTQFTEGVEKYLGSIGPLRRAELEFLALKEKLIDTLDEKSFFLVEEGVLESDQGWKSFFEEIDTEIKSAPLSFNKVTSYHQVAYENSDLPILSATRLQTYLDCPRKYLFKYNLKYSPEYMVEDQLDPLELGRVQHAIIETYVNENAVYEENKHIELASKLVDEIAKKKSLGASMIREHKLESLSNTRDAIERLLLLKGQEGVSISFESPIKEPGFRGSIDCIIEKNETVLLVDFKRGKGSITTQKGFKEYQKIQLWFYANHWEFQGKSLALGYICLSDPASSLLFFSDDNSRDDLKGAFDGKTCDLSKNFVDLFENYKNYESLAIERLKNDEEFPPRPLEPKVCGYCDLNKFCPRRAGAHNARS